MDLIISHQILIARKHQLSEVLADKHRYSHASEFIHHFLELPICMIHVFNFMEISNMRSGAKID